MTTPPPRLCKSAPSNKNAMVESALHAAGLSFLCQKFADASLDDAIVTRCLNNEIDINTVSELFPSEMSFLKFKVFYKHKNASLLTSGQQNKAGHGSNSNTVQRKGHCIELKSTEGKEGIELNSKNVDLTPPIAMPNISGQEDETGSGNWLNSNTSNHEERTRVAVVISTGVKDKPKVIPIGATEATLKTGQEDDAGKECSNTETSTQVAVVKSTGMEDTLKEFAVGANEATLKVSGQEDEAGKKSNSTEGPIQIVELVSLEEEDDDRTELVLQEAELRKIVSRVKDGRHVAVLTVAGPCDKGKSFLLSYIVTYLYSLRAFQERGIPLCSSGWIMKEGSRKAELLQGGFLWRSGSQKERTGIRMWSEPFPLKSRDGSEFDLLLVDTQGVVNRLTHENEFPTILGLSLLTSSLLIFNIFNTLSKTSLKILKKSMDFGHNAVGPTESGKEARPFQNLNFLINDWNSPDKYPFGANGGSDLLRANLDQKNKRSGTELRVQIKQSFEGLDCYLMPSPDSKGAEVNYHGSMADMNPEFVTHLEKFIVNILNRMTFPLNTIEGNRVTAEVICENFQKLVKVFNTGTESTSIPRTHDSNQIYNLIVLNNCKARYEAEMARLLQENQRKFLLENEFHEIHEKSVLSALTLFDNSKKMGTEPKIHALRDELITKTLQDVHEYHLLKNNEARRIAVHDALKKLKQIMTTDMEKARVDACVGDDKFCSDTILQHICESCKINASKKLESNLKISSTSCLSDTERADIYQVVSNVQTAVANNNQTYKDEREKALRDAITELTKSFSQEFKIATLNKCMIRKDLENLYSVIQYNFVKARLITEFGESSLLVEGQRYLRTKIGEIRKDLIFQAELVTNKLITDIEKFLAGLVTTYENHMDKQYPIDNHESLTLLSSIIASHKTGVQAAFQLFSEYTAIQALPETQKSKFKNELFKLLINKFKIYAQNSLVKIEEKLVNNYKMALKNYDGKSITPDSFYAEQKNTVETEFQKCLSDIRDIMHNECNVILASSKKTLSQTLSIYALSHKANITFSETLRTLSDDCEDVQKLNHLAHSAQLKQLQAFDTKTRSGFELIDLQTVRNELQSDLVKQIEDEKEFLEVNLRTKDAELKYFFPDVIKFYKSEMKKFLENTNITVTPKELEIHHREVSDRAVQRMKDKKMCEVTPYLEQEIQEHLKVPYKFYVDKMKMHNSTAAPAIGIDLGTTYSCVSIFRWHKGRPEFTVIENIQGEKTTPSHVHFPKLGNPIAGSVAKDKISTLEEPKVYDAKKLIGRRFADMEVQEDMKHWPFTVVKDSVDDTPNIKIQNKTVRPEEVSSYVLHYLKVSAEEYLKRKVKSAVITVPAYFNDAQRTATKEAGRIAGLNVLKIINEPTAAALAYDLDNHDEVEKTILIFDLGGGTFDVSVLHIKKGVINVKAVTGHTHLGGQDFDKELVQHCIQKFESKHGIDLLSDLDTRNLIRHRLENECEKKKRFLSGAVESVDIQVPRITPDHDLDITITKSTFEDLCEPRFMTCIDLVAKALTEAKLKKSEIDDVVLVGGSSRIPKVQEMLRQFFNGKVLTVTKSSDEVVARGAARLAFSLNEPQEGEASFLFSDVVPISLGIEIEMGSVEGRMSKIIPKNTAVPCSATNTYCAQGIVADIPVYEGENDKCIDNNPLGQFRVSGTTSGEMFKVTMEISDENILKVTAVSSKNSSNTSDIEIKFTR